MIKTSRFGKLTACLLVLALVFSVFPVTLFAEGGATEPTIEVVGSVPEVTVSELAELEEFSPASLPSITLKLNQNNAADTNVRIVLETTSGNAENFQVIAQDTDELWWNIVDNGWGPAVGFSLQAADGSSVTVYLVSDTAGTYTGDIKLVDVSNGNAVLATTPITVTVVDPDATFTISGTITGSDTEGAGIAGAAVSLTPTDGESIEEITDDQGEYELTSVPAGTYTLKVTADGYDEHTESFEVSANNDAKDIALTASSEDPDTITLDSVEIDGQALDPPAEGEFAGDVELSFMLYTNNIPGDVSHEIYLAGELGQELTFNFSGEVYYSVDGGGVSSSAGNPVVISELSTERTEISFFSDADGEEEIARVRVMTTAKVINNFIGLSETNTVKEVRESAENPNNNFDETHTGNVVDKVYFFDYADAGEVITITPAADGDATVEITIAGEVAEEETDYTVADGVYTIPITKAAVYAINVAFKGDPEIIGVTADPDEIDSADGASTITVAGTDLEDGITVTAFDSEGEETEITGTTTGNGTTQTVSLTFPANTTDADIVYTIKASLDDGGTWTDVTATVTVKVAGEDPAPTVTVTFNSMGGSSVPAQTVGADGTINRPADPTRTNYRFQGWYKDDPTQLWNFSTEITESMTLYAKWTYIGSTTSTTTTTTTTSRRSGSGSGMVVYSSDSRRATSTTSWGRDADDTPSKTTTTKTTAPGVTVTTEAAISAAKSAVETANGATARLRNPGDISYAALQDMADVSSLPLTLNADTLSADGSIVEVRLTLNPSAVRKDLNLSASTSNKSATACKELFNRWFSNRVMVVNLGQKGSFGQTVRIAAKLDRGLDTENLVFYSYDSVQNSYVQIKNPEFWVDNNGYVHFNTELAGDIVISDGALAKG